MKKLYFICFSLITIIALGQKSVRINQDIDALKISAGIQVELFTDAEENRIVANEKVFEAINYKVRDNQLRISSSIESLLDGDVPLNIKVYVNTFDNLNVVQGSGVVLKKLLNTNQLTLRAGEGSTISGEIEVDSVDITVLSGGVINLKGTAGSQNVEIKTGGEYEGKGLNTENTMVEVSYGGSAVVYVSKNCEAKVIVGGTIDIYGKPEYLNEKTNFGGEINLK